MKNYRILTTSLLLLGSFRDPENARKYQTRIVKQGFNSEILKNEAGLYRVSVLSTDEAEIAREKIRHIRKMFPEYFDTWLLVQKK
ncbi:MAG TPA: SPOR domain-containing protein [Bacteroidales bacterium]|nr:SPOR domain-containing protein [Bacteroidales bacterium]